MFIVYITRFMLRVLLQSLNITASSYSYYLVDLSVLCEQNYITIESALIVFRSETTMSNFMIFYLHMWKSHLCCICLLDWIMWCVMLWEKQFCIKQIKLVLWAFKTVKTSLKDIVDLKQERKENVKIMIKERLMEEKNLMERC